MIRRACLFTLLHGGEVDRYNAAAYGRAVILECDECKHPRGRVTSHLCRFSGGDERPVWRIRRPGLIEVLTAIELAGRRASPGEVEPQDTPKNRVVDTSHGRVQEAAGEHLTTSTRRRYGPRPATVTLEGDTKHSRCQGRSPITLIKRGHPRPGHGAQTTLDDGQPFRRHRLRGLRQVSSAMDDAGQPNATPGACLLRADLAWPRRHPLS